VIYIKSLKGDYSTNEVLAWLKHLDGKYFRHNTEFEESFEFLISKDKTFIKVNQREINLSQIHAFWYRRSDINKIVFDSNRTNIENKIDAYRNVNSEINHFKDFFIQKYKHKWGNVI
jgi:hypothetical protein